MHLPGRYIKVQEWARWTAQRRTFLIDSGSRHSVVLDVNKHNLPVGTLPKDTAKSVLVRQILETSVARDVWCLNGCGRR